MCGIAAVFTTRGSADPGQLDRMRDQMATRGPDGYGTWVAPAGQAGLAHRRLAIIDLSDDGAQPMFSADGQQAIVFNGEIYNYRDLRSALERRGHVFRSSSDTEVLLRLYAEKGETMVEDLRGMYAFAIWDEARQGLFLARDPYGIKPLYVADDGTTVRVASQVKALLAGGGIDTRPDPAGHTGFFLWGHVPEPYTLYRGIRALPAGTSLWAGADGARRTHTFASVPEVLAAAQSAPMPSGDATGLLREVLLDSVRHHLIADVEVGVFLSSGLDSTTLAALAVELNGRIRTLTLGFAEYRGKANDEVPLAETVAAGLGTEHQTIWIERADFQDAFDHLLGAMDQPTIDGVNSYFVGRAASQAGFKVALSGVGGDELFGGYPSFRKIPRLVSLLGSVPAGATLGRGFRVVSAPVLRRFTSPKYAGLLEYGTDYGGAYLLRRGFFMPWELPLVLDPDLVREGWAELQTRARLAGTTEGIETPRFKVTALESTWYMRNQLLRDTDWASMAHSLEVRTPLVDWSLLRTLAPLIAAHPELDKAAMARTPRYTLPDAVLNRPKTGFTIPVRDWLLAGRTDTIPERGLRGWARHIYRHFSVGTAG